MTTLRHPLALAPDYLARLKASGVVREKFRFAALEERDRREVASRAAQSQKPVLKAYNKLYSQFRRQHGRNPNPLEREQIQRAAAAHKAEIGKAETGHLTGANREHGEPSSVPSVPSCEIPSAESRNL